MYILYLIVAAVIIVVAAIQRGARFRVDLARIEAEKPDLRILLDLLSLVLRQTAAVQSHRFCE